MKKKSTMKWAALATGIILALCCAAFAATDHYAKGVTTEYNDSTLADADSIYGGASNEEITTGTNITVAGTKKELAIYGGGHAVAASGSNVAADVSGDTRVAVTGSTEFYMLAGGGHVYDDGLGNDWAHSGVQGDTYVTLNLAQPCNGTIVGGGHAHGTQRMNADTSDTHIIVNGGGVNNAARNHCSIIGGGYAMYAGGANVNNTNIVINNCNIGNDDHPTSIVGGGYTLASVNTNGGTRVNGDTNITFNGGENAKIRRIKVFGGGYMAGTGDGSMAIVEGNTNITVNGVGGLALVSEGVEQFSGAGFTKDDFTGNVSVSGDKKLIFNNVGMGTIAGEVANFDYVILSGDTELTFAKPISSDVKKIVITGDYSKTAKKTVLALAAGSYTPSFDITGAKGIKNCEWDGMNLVVTGSGEESKENPAEPEKPIFEGDVEKVISKDVEAVAPAVSTDKTAVAAELKSTDITSSDLDSDASGRIVLKKSVVVTAGGSYSDAYMLPIFTAAKTTSADIVACSFAVKSSDLLAKTPQEVKLLKIKGKSSTVSFKYSDKAEDFLKDGYFTIQTSGDNKIADKAAAFTADVYKVTMFIKDNGDYDLDPTAGSILDPSAIVKASESGSGGSSGGCSAGFAAIALLAIVPVVVRRKK